ncbi:adenosine receptor A3-like [Tubulanus polymorphus]|uniref:adenosine receptor A3-like n=1 Tax=Tubulanus polymorphus TaxID=672921 RepID=UPI003DA3818E
MGSLMYVDEVRNGSRVNCSRYILPPGSGMKHIVLLTMFFMAFFVLTGNMLVLAFAIAYKNLRTRFDRLLVSLSLADTIVGIVIFPLVQLFTSEPGNASIRLCLAMHTLVTFSLMASCCNVLCITVNRYIAVRGSTFYRKHADRITTMTIVIGWLIPTVYVMGRMTSADPAPKCCHYIAVSNVANHVTNTLALTVPILGLLTLNADMIRILYKQNRVIAGNTGMNIPSHRESNAYLKRTLITTCALVFASIICWTPFLALYWKAMTKSEGKNLDLAARHSVMLIIYSNSFINPIIYVFCNKNYHQAFRDAFKCLMRNETSPQLSNGVVALTSAQTSQTLVPRNPTMYFSASNVISPGVDRFATTTPSASQLRDSGESSSSKQITKVRVNSARKSTCYDNTNI